MVIQILFFLPWAATCLSAKLGLSVTIFYVWLHYTFKKPILKRIETLLEPQLDNSTTCSYDYNQYAVEEKSKQPQVWSPLEHVF